MTDSFIPNVYRTCKDCGHKYGVLFSDECPKCCEHNEMNLVFDWTQDGNMVVRAYCNKCNEFTDNAETMAIDYKLVRVQEKDNV
jgi:hypothetical protein